MAESGSRSPANLRSALSNLKKMGIDPDDPTPESMRAVGITGALRRELLEKGFKGFRRGGAVKKTGPAKLHKGERVLAAKRTNTKTTRGKR